MKPEIKEKWIAALRSGEGEDMIIDAQALYELADELEELE